MYYNFLQKNPHVIKFKYALLKFQELDIAHKCLNGDQKIEISKDDEKVYLYQQGLIQTHIKTCNKMSCFCVQHRMKKHTNRVILAILSSLYDNKICYLDSLIQQVFMDPIYGINEARNYLILFKKNSKNVVDRFRLF